MPALDPGRGLFRAKSPLSAFPAESAARVRSPSPPKVRSPVKVPERFKSPEAPSKVAEQIRSPEPPQAAPEPVLKSDHEQNGVGGKSLANGTAMDIKHPDINQMETTDDQGLTRKKVVKVVRRVVRKVLSTDEGEATVPTQRSDKAPAAEPAKAASPASVSKPAAMPAFSFKHDAIKMEDKDDISRGLTNLMVRGRTREVRPRLQKEEKREKLELEKKNEKKEEEVELKEKKEGKDVNHENESSGPGIQEVKSHVINPTNMASQRSTPSKSPHSRPTSLPPVVGFIPAPKATPLSPPPGFIPAPKPTTAKKLPAINPPSTSTVAEKPSSVSPASHFSQTPVSSEPALPNPSPVPPPPGVTPAQQSTVSQKKVQSPHLACLPLIFRRGVERA